MLKESKTGYFPTQITLNIQPEAIYSETDKANSTAKWSAIEKVESSQSHIFLFTGPSNAIVIPNTAFESSAEREKFVETVMEYRENAAGVSSVLA